MSDLIANNAKHMVTVWRGSERHQLQVVHGANLRQTLLAAGLSPYTRLTKKANCGGRGLCATCGVIIENAAPPPTHWHDKLADRFDYPRLSCQITIEHDLIVRLMTDKIIWGSRSKKPKNNEETSNENSMDDDG